MPLCQEPTLAPLAPGRLGNLVMTLLSIVAIMVAPRMDPPRKARNSFRSASVMFGYFLRKADQRFQLAKSMGVLPEDNEDAVARLERLFSMV